MEDRDKLEFRGVDEDTEVRVPGTDLWLYCWDVDHGFNSCNTLTQMLARIEEDYPGHDMEKVKDYLSAGGEWYKD